MRDDTPGPDPQAATTTSTMVNFNIGKSGGIYDKRSIIQALEGERSGPAPSDPDSATRGFTNHMGRPIPHMSGGMSRGMDA